MPQEPRCGTIGRMDSLERLVVHVEEAVRLATMDDDPHLRIGLMLLDSAAELLLRRQCSWRVRRAKQAGELSSGKAKQIDRQFPDKCDYLLGIGLLTEPHATVLKKLHDYRNELYHRDQVRLATLASATRIYVYLVCSLMQDFPLHEREGLIRVSSTPPTGLLKYLENGESVQSLLSDGSGPEFQARIAARLRSEAGITEPSGLGQVLSQHFCDRLDAVREAAEEAGNFFRQASRDQEWDWEAVLSLAQLKHRRPLRLMSPREVKSSADVKVRLSQISEWRARGEALASQTDSLAAFEAFADLESKQFEELERNVITLAGKVEQEAEDQYNLAHGR